MLSRLRHVFLAAASGLVLSFALPEPGTWLAAWVGLVPLFIALRSSTPSRAALCGVVAGAVYYGIILYWITLFGFLPWILLVLYQALYFAVFAMLCVRLAPERAGWRGFLAIPALWVVLQYLKTLGPYAFIWGSFAHTQADNVPFAQISSVTGPWGIDFALCFLNLALANALQPRVSRRYVPLIIAAGLTLLICIFGVTSIPKTEPTQSSRVAILQGNMKNDFDPVPNYEKIAYALYSRMTAEAAKKGVDLVIWPETTLAVDIASPEWANLLSDTARKAGVELLIGGYDASKDPMITGSYNSVFLFDKSGRIAGVYHKVQLVPFGEFVPLRDRLPMLRDYGVRPDDVLAAKTHSLVDTSIGKVGVSICFESLFPEIARGETLSGANLLCVVTNDAWFERTQAAREHLLMAKLRAIENRRYVLRAAGTGISAVIDPYGRTSQELGLFRQGTIISGVQPSSALTFYTRFGQWFAYLCIAILVVCLPLPLRALRAPSGGARHQETEPALEHPQSSR